MTPFFYIFAAVVLVGLATLMWGMVECKKGR